MGARLASKLYVDLVSDDESAFDRGIEHLVREIRGQPVAPDAVPMGEPVEQHLYPSESTDE